MTQKVQIGNCTLYHGDCMEVMPAIEDMDACVTDPPYGLAGNKIIKMTGGGKNAQAWHNNCKKMAQWDYLKQDEINYLINRFKYLIIWGGNYYRLPPSRMFLIWDKGGGMRGRTFAEGEMAWCSWDGNARIKEYNHLREALDFNKKHPTQKPLEIMKWCISHLPEKCQTILDPFMGSGTTGVACQQMGRKFMGIELDKEYFELACDRIYKASRQGDLFIQ